MKDQTPVRILDGGLGTSLEDKYQVQFSSDSTPLWSSHLLVSDQKTLLECQTDFACAGANVLLTATYQTSIAGFASTRTPEWPRGISLPNIGQFLEDATLIAQEACCRGGEVAISLGPYGATMIPSTEYSAEYDADHADAKSLFDWHLERWMLFAKSNGSLSGVSYVAFETIPRLDEIAAIRRMILGNAKIPVWISAVFPGDGDKLPDGSSVEDVVRTMLSAEVAAKAPWGIGINCTKVDKLDSLVRRYEKGVQEMVDLGDVLGWPSLVLYPDGTNGEVYNTATKTWELPAGAGGPKAGVCGDGF